MTDLEKKAEDAEFHARAEEWRRMWEHLPRSVAKADYRRELYARWRGDAA